MRCQHTSVKSRSLSQGPVSVAASAKLGKVIDLAWVPLPAPIGGGSVIVVAGEDGSLAVVDATQTVEHRSLRKRLAAFKKPGRRAVAVPTGAAVQEYWHSLFVVFLAFTMATLLRCR